MKKLPIGIQEFSKLREGGFLYVDKTEHIYSLINSASYYFISRPRRFGKSLLLNTIKELFLGNKELFEGLWIYDKIEWDCFPVLKISFSTLDYEHFGLAEAINNKLDQLGEEFNIKYEQTSFSLKFEELIRKLSGKSKVVILIDEYDKPIIDYIEDIEKAEENRNILKSFYSVIKDSDNYIRFFFITGVSKFSQVSVFSDLNNLNDITLNRKYSTMLGYTQAEMDYYFSDYIKELQEIYKNIYPDVVSQIKRNYNGYSWDGKNFVYNPFSVLILFDSLEFGDYWFNTGTPTFLMKMIKQNNYTIFDLANRVISKNDLNKYEITSMTLLPLLFQTGYLTIKESNPYDLTYTLDFPNMEVERSFTIHLLSSFNDGKIDKTSSMIVQMIQTLRNNEINVFIELVNSVFKGLSYSITGKEEKYFHSIFYVIVRLLGFTIDTEILTIDGRIDAVVSTDNFIYIFEFKAGYNAMKALQQIKEKEYHKKYIGGEKRIVLIGINFNVNTKSIDEIKVENV